MTFILISVHPKHSQNIFSGKKRFEFRKRLPAQAPEAALVYETTPTQAIVGVLMIKGAYHEAPAKLWRRTSRGAGVDKARFHQYFKGSETAHALEVGKALQLRKPIPLSKIKIERAPQSWQYIDENQFRKIANSRDAGHK